MRVLFAPPLVLALLLVLGGAVVGCDGQPPNVCLEPPMSTTTPTPAQICAHLARLGCRLESRAAREDTCVVAYAEFMAANRADVVERTTRCYIAAPSCFAVSTCNRACAPSMADASVDAPVDAESDTTADTAIDAVGDVATSDRP